MLEVRLKKIELILHRFICDSAHRHMLLHAIAPIDNSNMVKKKRREKTQLEAILT